MADPQGLPEARPRGRRRAVRSRSACSDWNEVYPGGPGRALLPIIKTQAGRCMDCGIPFCHQGCPLGNLIPEWNDLVWRDDWDGAIERLHATNNFPEFTGRLCPAPCETACVLGINQDPVTIKNVEVAIIDRAWESGAVRPQPPEWLSGKTVAVIGSGPAGLAAAQQLTRAGHTVAVYERADKIGGLLRYGIPEFKMEKSVLDRRLDQMRREGTVFRAGVDVGRDAHRRPAARPLRRGRARHRRDRRARPAGPGPRARRHPPGDGVPAAVQPGLPRRGGRGPDPRRRQARRDHRRRRHRRRLPRHRASARARESITQLEIMDRPGEERPANQPWPTYPMIFRVSSAHEEGGDRVYSVSTKEFLGDDDGNVRALRLVEVTSRTGSSRRSRAPSARSRPSWCCSRWASPVRSSDGLVEQLGVELDERGNVARDADYQSSVEGVFVAGDAGRGQSLIVWAIAEGRAAAAAVDTWLTGGTTLPAPIPPTERAARPR